MKPYGNRRFDNLACDHGCCHGHRVHGHGKGEGQRPWPAATRAARKRARRDARLFVRAAIVAAAVLVVTLTAAAILSGCHEHELVVQDQKSLLNDQHLTEDAYCRLLGLDAGGIAAARAEVRAAHAESTGVLNRNGVDAGDLNPHCPTP